MKFLIAVLLFYSTANCHLQFKPNLVSVGREILHRTEAAIEQLRFEEQSQDAFHDDPQNDDRKRLILQLKSCAIELFVQIVRLKAERNKEKLKYLVHELIGAEVKLTALLQQYYDRFQDPPPPPQQQQEPAAKVLKLWL